MLGLLNPIQSTIFEKIAQKSNVKIIVPESHLCQLFVGSSFLSVKTIVLVVRVYFIQHLPSIGVDFVGNDFPWQNSWESTRDPGSQASQKERQTSSKHQFSGSKVVVSRWATNTILMHCRVPKRASHFSQKNIPSAEKLSQTPRDHQKKP